MAVGLKNNELVFEFPEIGPESVLRIKFHRTNRIPDDKHDHHLPPSLGAFALRDVHHMNQERLPGHWAKRGGVVIPMWQTEAMWMSFRSDSGYPFAVKICVGKVNAVTGKPWSEDLKFGDDQDFVEVPHQPWIDGICVEKGVIRQFVAMPLGKGYTVEGQVTGKEEHGGVQILVRPLTSEAWNKRQAEKVSQSFLASEKGMDGWPAASSMLCGSSSVFRSMSPKRSAPDMGLGAGGRMKQEIYSSKVESRDWDAQLTRCFVAIANAETWAEMTGEAPLPMPESYAAHVAKGGPVYEIPMGGEAVSGGVPLKNVKTVKDFGSKIGEKPIKIDISVDPASVETVKLAKYLPVSGAKVVADGEF